MMTATPAVVGAAAEDRLHVMTVNVRLDRPGETRPGEADHWPERAPLLTGLLEREQPTVLGVQEPFFTQLPAIEAALPSHERVGYGRQGGSRDEHCCLYVDSRRLEVLAWDQLWLSDTPEVIGSASWGNEIPRVVVWARLRERGSGRELVAVNTHLDHASEPARVRGARLLRELVLGPLAGAPLVLTGDFNAPVRACEAYRVLVDEGPLEDTWQTAERRLTPEWGSFPAYAEPVEGAERIDWILATPDVTVEAAAVNDTRAAGRFHSDHLPVQALLRLS